MNEKRINVITLGGTILQKANSTGSMSVALPLEQLIDQVNWRGSISTSTIETKVGANLNLDILCTLQEHIDREADNFEGFVVTTGTDSLEELAYFLHLALKSSKPVAVTGAMRTSEQCGYDGVMNLRAALRFVSSDRAATMGVLVVFNDEAHLAKYVWKQDSQAMNAFRSYPGPLGAIKSGEVEFYYDPIGEVPALYFDRAKLLSLNVPIMMFAVGMQPRKFSENEIDGLVIAGMGTSSLSDDWIDFYGHDLTSAVPVVLVSRCPQGKNFDDDTYKGSLKKYENRGFILREYKDLNPMQARLRLLLKLSA